uniref:Uncharacterized protein TCIL3000_9_5270 n=1 Tax=Trypanosoma congolense (strain IL3000) TaxID=1068625 RepID=G0UUQ6_TRYCI|nr:unnamed protein product [Trypanosoma congolense IL3000]
MSSKYDRVKVKVYLSEEHFYTLSRFILSRVLASCKLPTTVAVCVSLAVKKLLVDREMLNISQAELERSTLLVMAQHGYGNAHGRFLHLMSRFFIERIPLIVFIAGTGCCGKTAIARGLSVKLNTHNIVSTEVLFDILKASYDVFSSIPHYHGDDTHVDTGVLQQEGEHSLWLLEAESEEGFVERWRTLAKLVRPLVQEEVEKALREGRVLIVEGSLLDLSLYHSYLVKDFQEEYGVVTVAFYVSSDKLSRSLAADRLLNTIRNKPSSICNNDNVVASEALQRRLSTIGALHLKMLQGENNRMRLRPIDGRVEDVSCPSDDCNITQRCAEHFSPVSCENEQEIVEVYHVEYSESTSLRPCELMHGLVVDKVISALKQREMTKKCGANAADGLDVVAC